MFKSILMGGAIPFARLQDSSKTSIVRAMDAGAYGLIIPNIESKEQLQDVVKFANYPPKGREELDIVQQITTEIILRGT